MPKKGLGFKAHQLSGKALDSSAGAVANELETALAFVNGPGTVQLSPIRASHGESVVSSAGETNIGGPEKEANYPTSAHGGDSSEGASDQLSVIQNFSREIEPQEKSPLLTAPPEVRRKIWTLSIQHGATIQPRQVQHMSNKFTHGAARSVKINTHSVWRSMFIGSEKFISTEPTLTVVQLSLVCHQIYAEIAGEGLFYKVNDFKFRSMSVMLHYLVAIAPSRLNNLRSVSVSLSGGVLNNHAATMLATCEGLQSLKIFFDQECLAYNWYIDGLSRFKVIRGLSKFEVVLERVNGQYHPEITTESRVRMNALVDELRQVVTGPRGGPTVSFNEIRFAQQQAKLNIHGGGRLGEDKKPGVVASRTRGQLRRQKELNDLGVIDEPAPPKYSKSGELLWYISYVTDSRLSVDSQGLPSVELYIDWVGEENDASWEDCSDVIGPDTIFEILRLYHRDPDKCGFDIVSALAKERLKGEPSSKRLAKEVSAIKGRVEALENFRSRYDLGVAKQD